MARRCWIGRETGQPFRLMTRGLLGLVLLLLSSCSGRNNTPPALTLGISAQQQQKHADLLTFFSEKTFFLSGDALNLEVKVLPAKAMGVSALSATNGVDLLFLSTPELALALSEKESQEAWFCRSLLAPNTPALSSIKDALLEEGWILAGRLQGASWFLASRDNTAPSALATPRLAMSPQGPLAPLLVKMGWAPRLSNPASFADELAQDSADTALLRDEDLSDALFEQAPHLFAADTPAPPWLVLARADLRDNLEPRHWQNLQKALMATLKTHGTRQRYLEKQALQQWKNRGGKTHRRTVALEFGKACARQAP